MFLMKYALIAISVQCLSAIIEGNCAEKSQKFQSILQAARSGRLVDVSPPDCDHDGSFSPVQCSGTSCYCVSKDGDRILRSPGSPYYGHVRNLKDMDCRCARHQYEYKTAGLIGPLVHCSTNGNYDTGGD